MKTSLRSGLFLALLVFVFNKASSQCSASNILIQNIEPIGVQTPGSCTAKFDLSFQMEANNGNKYIFVHAWAQSQYPDFFDCVDGHPSSNGTIHPPEASDLTDAFLNLAIDHSGPSATLMTNYPPDNGVVLNSADSVSHTILPNGSSFFIIYGVTATFPGSCDSAYLIAFDFWSSQSSHAQNAQCVNCNVLYPLNFLNVTGAALCGNLSYNVQIQNRTNMTVSGYVLVYADVNGDGFLGDAVDVLIRDTTAFTIAPGPGTTTNIVGLPGSIPMANINQNLLVVTHITSNNAAGAAQVDLLISTQCAPLPVNFKSFTAYRVNRTNVSLRWETATEINNRGFAIERRLDGNWTQVAFIPSQAPDGNSNSPLIYTFDDLNSYKGISQYRIRQVDLDGRARYSDIRAVRGWGQRGTMIVYPNPSADGRINVVFDDAEGTRNINLIDASGRVLRQWKSITTNTLFIDNLRAGMYTLRVQNMDTGEISVERVVVISN